MAEETNTTQTAADIVSTVTAQRKLAEASGQVAENIAQSFEQISEVFQKTNKTISELGGTFSKLFGDINSVNDIPLIDTIGDMTMAMDKRLGLIVKTLITVAESLNKIDAAFVGLRRTSVITGASFGQSSMEVKRYADNQMATLSRLSRTLAVKTEEFDRYQEALRGMAFSYRDLDQNIQAWGPRRAIVGHMFAISKGLGMEFSTVLKDFEDLTLRAGHASGNFTKNAEATTRIYRGFAYSAQRLGVTTPFIRDEIMKAVTGHWTSITNIENRATDLRINYEKFYTQLAKQGQEGLAGDFLAKVQGGLSNLNLGQAAWMTGTTGVGSIADSLTLMAQIRDASGGGRVQPMLATVKKTLERYSNTSVESINQMIERGADLPHLAMQHTFQREQIKSLFHITDEGEAENLMGLINKMFAEGTSAEERAKIPEAVTNILAQGKGVAQQQLTALQGIAINVKGLFLHYVYGSGAEKILESQLGETPEEFERRHLADQEKELKRPLTPEEKQSTLSRARELWVNLREMVAVGAVEPGGLGDALKALEGGDVDFSGNVGGTRAGHALPGATKPGQITSKYGYRIDPITGQSSFHHGVDIAAKVGTLISTPVAGEATYHPEGGPHYRNMGNVVSIQAGDTLHIFAHLEGAAPGFKNGRVEVGEPIGITGSTGRSTGGHLHYQVQRLENGKYSSYRPAESELNYLEKEIAKNSGGATGKSGPPMPPPYPNPRANPLSTTVKDAGAGTGNASNTPDLGLPPSNSASGDTKAPSSSSFGTQFDSLGKGQRPFSAVVTLTQQRTKNDPYNGFPPF